MSCKTFQAYLEHAKIWSRINESNPNSAAKAKIIKKLQPAPASPRIADDITKAPISDQDYAKNALDQRISSVTNKSKLDLAIPETYSDASNATN